MQLEAIGATYATADHTEPADPIRVMIADDEDAIRAAILAVLDADPTIIVVGEASDAQTAIELAVKRQPAVALLDVRMPRGGGPRAASEIAKRSPETRVIALSAMEDAASILEMLDAGADAYVGKADDTDKIVSTIHRLAEEPPASVEATRDRRLDEVLHGSGWLDRRRERAEQVRAVIDAGGPRIVYQPLFDLTDGEYIGAEALARFDATPTRSPERWFEEADKAGLRIEMELSALRSAVADLDRLPAGTFLSVNASPVTCCSPDLPEVLADADPSRVVLELTEHTQVTDYQQLSRCLKPMRARGVRIAVDDTGAGFSSLSHVLALAPELIKLDIAMCRDVERDGARQALIHALVDFAGHIGAGVVAEGIESSEQLLALRDVGVRYGQGFFLGRAEPLEAMGGS
jgi:EAL domain-containing protein (putative c-di-GMP-specific phosphodiesterase class I)/DNA-binding NarL/FixJ family response regulator